MALLEDGTAVFIVRVWRERGDTDASIDTIPPEWRGSVEHLQSGQRMFFRTLETVGEFMKPHLEKLGIDPQQRFWERMSAAIDAEPDADANAHCLVTEPAAFLPPTVARKRR
jgi:hypothetical protein